MRILKNYHNFRNLETINEDVNKAKKMLRQNALFKKAVDELGLMSDDLEYKIKDEGIRTLKPSLFNDSDLKKIKDKLREINLDDREKDAVEKNADFIKIKDILDKNKGYIYPFAYMYFMEDAPMEEIESLYAKVLEYKDILDRLKDIPEVGKKFGVNFIDTSLPNDKEHRTNVEILSDGLSKLEGLRNVNKIVNTLPTGLKKKYKKASKQMKEQMAGIANSFESIPDEMTQQTDHTGKKLTLKEVVWKTFFGEMKKDNYRTLPDGSPNPNFGKYIYSSRLKKYEDKPNPLKSLIEDAQKHIDAALKGGYSKKLDQINKCIDTYGDKGCEIIFNENGIIIVQVNSRLANKMLNSDTSHCIVDSDNYWESYIGDYNVQYYIYNYNLSSSDPNSIIGVTIDPNNSFSSGACQNKSNSYIGNNFDNMLKKWSDEYNTPPLRSLLKPLDNEEVQRRKKAKEANKKLVKSNITVEEIENLVKEYGADIDHQNGAALTNAVKENDLEKTKYLLKLGANPNIGGAIKYAENFEMVKLLVEYGSELSNNLLRNLINDGDAIKFLLDNGLDPNMNKMAPMRMAIKGSFKDGENYGEAYLDSIKALIDAGAESGFGGKNRVIHYVTQYGRVKAFKLLYENGYFDDLSKEELKMRGVDWVESSPSLKDENKKEMADYIRSIVEKM
jgi:hypothetical protein